MKIIVSENKKLVHKEIDGKLETMQKIVDGHIESLKIPFSDVYMFVNEEGLYRSDLKKTVYIPYLKQIIVGNFFFARVDKYDISDVKDGDIEAIMQQIILL